MAHSTNPTPTNEQEAINIMLASIGERPVDNIHDSQRLDVLNAITALNQVNVQIQTRGWWFNSEVQELSPNVDGEYEIPVGIQRVVPAFKSEKAKFVQRGNRLYNTLDNTYTGNTADLCVVWVRLLPFNDLPETARSYIAHRAGVKFQKRTVGSPTLFEFTKEDEAEALGLFQEESLDQEGANVFDSIHFQGIINER